MVSHVSKFGIYLNPSEQKVVRITSPYWFPDEPEWVYITNEVNATLIRLRDIIRQNSLAPNPDEVTWGRIPLKD